MTTKELFTRVTSKREWYKPIGMTSQAACVYKDRAKNGTLSEGKMYEILVKLGYKYEWHELNHLCKNQSNKIKS